MDFTAKLRRACASLCNISSVYRYYRHHDKRKYYSVLVKKYNHLMDLLSQTDLFEEIQINKLELTEKDRYHSKMDLSSGKDLVEMDLYDQSKRPLKKKPRVEQIKTNIIMLPYDYYENPNYTNVSFETSSIIADEKVQKLTLNGILKYYFKEIIEFAEKFKGLMTLDSRKTHLNFLHFQCEIISKSPDILYQESSTPHPEKSSFNQISSSFNKDEDVQSKVSKRRDVERNQLPLILN